MDLYEYAQKLSDEGFVCIPQVAVQHKNGKVRKKPIVKKWQKRGVATKEELKEWFEGKDDVMLSVLCGRPSNIIAIDCDSEEGYNEIAKHIPYQSVVGIPMPVIAKTPSRNGRHFYFKCPSIELPTINGILKDVDLKCGGGLITIPPSQIKGVGSYEFMDSNNILSRGNLTEMPKSLEEILKGLIDEKIKKGINGDGERDEGFEYFSEGRRDNDLFSISNALIKSGANPSLVKETLTRVALSWGENDERWIDEKVDSAIKRNGNYNSGLKIELKSWIDNTFGYFSLGDLYKDFNILSKEDKAICLDVLRKMVCDGYLEQSDKRNGVFRRIDKEELVIDWKNADISKVYPLYLPFNIHRYVAVYPKNIIVVAGAPNSGKTAFMLNILRDNMNLNDTYYFSSEMGAEEMKLRLNKFDEGLEEWNFTAIDRMSNFSDVIRPDALNLIDYMEISDNFYAIGEEIRKIHDKLSGGVCIIAMQKKIGASLGRGAEFSLEKPRLYITMDAGTARLVKAKNWKNEDLNPNGMEFKFKLAKGCKFIQVGGYQ